MTSSAECGTKIAIDALFGYFGAGRGAYGANRNPADGGVVGWARPKRVSDQRLDDYRVFFCAVVKVADEAVGRWASNNALAAFHRLASDSFKTMPITGHVFRSTAQIADRHL